MRTRSIVNLADVPLRDFGNDRAFAAKLGRVGPLIGAKKLGCQLHIVPAAKKAFPRHAHHANEEMFFILSGAGIYRVRRNRRAGGRRRDSASNRQHGQRRATLPGHFDTQ